MTRYEETKQKMQELQEEMRNSNDDFVTMLESFISKHVKIALELAQEIDKLKQECNNG